MRRGINCCNIAQYALYPSVKGNRQNSLHNSTKNTLAIHVLAHLQLAKSVAASALRMENHVVAAQLCPLALCGQLVQLRRIRQHLLHS